ncbi:MAG: GNAT family N-acetyltransferase, partial [Chloroflexi bacterium]|nr:GNAT family N-acetyltransferase [Chloroflexota bacterium]
DLLPKDFLAHLSVERREQQWREQLCAENSTAFCFVAEDDSKQIVGFASGGAARSDREKFDGELYAIYLLEAYQRRGIGKELFEAVAARLKREGYRAMLLWVLEQNAARGFYERLGGKFLRAQPITIGETTLDELAYGWEWTT